MIHQDIPLEKLSNLCINAVLGVNDLLKTAFYSEFNVKSKSDIHDILTEYDTKSEEQIMDLINQSFPKHAIVAEESGLSGSLENNYYWLIDPIDGTWNFARQIPTFCTALAVCYGNSILASAVLNPMTNELFAASKGQGAYLNGKKIHTSMISLPSHAGVSMSRTTHPHLFNEFGVIRRTGSSILDLCFVAAGRIEAFLSNELNPWDIAAGALIIEEAQGICTTLENQPISVKEKNSVFASNKKIRSNILQLINEQCSTK